MHLCTKNGLIRNKIKIIHSFQKYKQSVKTVPDLKTGNEKLRNVTTYYDSQGTAWRGKGNLEKDDINYELNLDTYDKI